jgi:hypothetical protein
VEILLVQVLQVQVRKAVVAVVVAVAIDLAAALVVLAAQEELEFTLGKEYKHETRSD